jgi:hypothetical protein
MADPITVIIRFNGDPDELLERFERARRLWTDAQRGDYERPAFYAACTTDDGIVVVNGWEDEAAHKTFGHQLGSHLAAVGVGKPDQVERMPIGKLGWD